MSVNVLKEIENKGNTVEAYNLGVVDLGNVAESFAFLQKIIDEAKLAQAKLAPTLLEEDAEFFFKESEQKVIVTPGKVTKTIDPKLVQEYCTMQNFVEMVSLTEKSIKDTYKKVDGKGFSEEAEVIIAKSVSVTKVGSPSVKAKKMTKKELLES